MGWLTLADVAYQLGLIMRRFQCAVLAAVAVIGFASIGSAADLPTKAPAYNAPAPIAYSWTGWYVGGNVGGAWSRSDVSTSVPCSAACAYFSPANAAAINANGGSKISGNGAIGGIQAGYNVQSGSFVYGLEADINFLSAKTSRSLAIAYLLAPTNGNIFTDEVKANWIATLRPRIGVLVGGILPYVTGGLAVTTIKHTHGVTENFFGTFCGFCNIDPASETSKTKLGWTVGGGAEWAVGGNWSVKGEYLYTSFGSVDSTSSYVAIPAQTFNHSANLSVQTVRLGLNFKLGQ